MHQTLIQRYENGCLMLLDEREDGFHFLGTAFMVDAGGYLLTAAHLLRAARKPVVAYPAPGGDFTPLAIDEAQSYPVAIAQEDAARDLALLKMELDFELSVPDDLIGNPQGVGEGTHLLTFGVSFGHFRIHNTMVTGSLLSAKLISPNDTCILVFDTQIHTGDAGGPMVNTETGRIIGLVQGIFNPLMLQELKQPEDYQMPSNFSYAVSMDYARPLFEAEGLKAGSAGMG